MNQNSNNFNRHIELSAKFVEMGQALIKEGQSKNDYNITQAGGFFILIGGVILDEEDVFIFGQLCSMFSAKKFLDEMNNKEKQSEKSVTKDEAFQKLLAVMKKASEDVPSKATKPKKTTLKKAPAKKPIKKKGNDSTDDTKK